MDNFNSEDQEDQKTREDRIKTYHEKERNFDNKFADFMVGAILVGSFITVIAMYFGWIGKDNDLFGMLGCMVVGYFLHIWFLKPFLEKRGKN